MNVPSGSDEFDPKTVSATGICWRRNFFLRILAEDATTCNNLDVECYKGVTIVRQESQNGRYFSRARIHRETGSALDKPVEKVGARRQVQVFDQRFAKKRRFRAENGT